MKKTLLSLGILSTFGLNAQGLEGIIVEKFYVSNKADSIDADANGAVTPLRIGSVTYRVFADLLPGYSISAMYGDANHDFKVETTTAFYNDANFGTSIYSGVSVNNTKKNTQLIDSYFTIGGVANGMIGVPKEEDTDGSIGNNQGILANDVTSIGFPITGVNGRDGMMPGSPKSLNTLGLTNELNLFDQTNGSSFLAKNATIAALGGVQGITATNKVLLGQFTTDGVFSFTLNLQLLTPQAGGSELYVASNPVGKEMEHATLSYTSKTSTAGLDQLGNLDAQVMLYPNPAGDKLAIRVSNVLQSTATGKIELLNINGQLLQEQRVNGQNGLILSTIDLSDCQKGMYLVRIQLGDDVFVRQVVHH